MTLRVGRGSRSEAFSIRRLGGSRWRLRRTRCAMGFECQSGIALRDGGLAENSQSGVEMVAALALSEQVGLIASQLIRPELIRRLAKMAGERSHVLQVLAGGDLRVVATLEFFQHH